MATYVTVSQRYAACHKWSTTVLRYSNSISNIPAGVAKSQNCIPVHGQVVLIKHLSVPMHFMSVLLQIQMQVFKKWFNKQNYDLTATFMFNIL